MTLVKNAGLVSTAPQHEFFSYGAVGAFRFDFGHASSLAFQHDEMVAQSTRQIGAGRSATRRVEPDCRAVRVLSREIGAPHDSIAATLRSYERLTDCPRRNWYEFAQNLPGTLIAYFKFR